uniref:Late endosomal/lysosomal adaptor and MAPK and MTOR activator 4 n=2 Tax=Anopheles albimanus TaxID=7167 RepID=A0A182FFR4_ANOAL
FNRIGQLTLASASAVTSGSSFSTASTSTSEVGLRFAPNLTEVRCESCQQQQQQQHQTHCDSGGIRNPRRSIALPYIMDLERNPVPDQLGYLVLTEDGSVHASGGELENDERRANIISTILSLTDTVDPAVFKPRSCRTISIVYPEHSYTICLSNKRIYVVKKRVSENGNSGNLGEGHSIRA